MDNDPQDKPTPRRDEAYSYSPVPTGPETPGGASEPIPAQFSTVPSSTGVPTGVPTWEWQGSAAGTAPPPPPPPTNAWITVVGPAPARPAGYDAPSRGDSQEGSWRQTPVVRWLSRIWPLILLGLSKAKWLLVLFKF